MDILQNLLGGFSIAMSGSNLMYAFLGALLGTAVGVLPGLGPSATISILLPMTYSMNSPTSSIIFLAGIFYGAMYGGSTTSILMRLPGEAASVITCIDGYEMAKKGRAGAALAIAAIGSFVAGTVGVTLTGEYIRRTRGKQFGVLSGRDTLIHACLCYGGSGSIAACANVAPRLCADIYDKYVQGDIKGSLEAQYTLAPLRIAFTLGTFPAVIKEALELIGIEAGACMSPVAPLSVEEREQLRKILKQMHLV